MSRFARIHRRPDHWSSAHERARARAAERLDGPLGLTEATWLDEHLAACASCAAVAAAYDADRQSLRALRTDLPEPPRDLWARTSAAIEQESRASGRSRTATSGGLRRIPVGALSGFAVIAVVVAVSAVSGGFFDPNGGTTALVAPSASAPTDAGAGPAETPGEIAGAAPTPFDVGAGDVEWFGKASDGQVAYNAASVREVCPVESADSCATIDESAGEHLALSAPPKSIIGSPTEQQAIVVTDDGSGGQQITVLSLPDAGQIDTSAPESPSPTATEPPATDPPASEPAATPSGSPEATGSPEVTAEPSDQPSEAPSSTPDVTPTPEPLPTPTEAPTLSPEPTIAATLAIARDIAVVGESAAFSADGAWFAFTARPIDGSAGPDVYVWHVGDELAHRVTTDGSTVFASWDDGTIVASRPAAAERGEAAAATVLIDPVAGTERAGGDLWRPVVDPTARRAVAWAGTVLTSDDGTTTTPADGRLELRGWSAETGAVDGEGASQVITAAHVTDFDVRWDETGTWFAIWIADPAGTDVGRLSLYRVDPATGLLEHPDGAPVDVAALPGFSIGQGRLAWATPPGQGGEGSRVQIVAWAPDGVGTVETAPGEDLIVVR